jgi:hypothetical protein
MEITHQTYPGKLYAADSIQLFTCMTMASTENKTAHYKFQKIPQNTVYKTRTTHRPRLKSYKNETPLTGHLQQA